MEGGTKAKTMNIVLVHNYYQQPGGEDRVFAAEASLLESHGHRVARYTAHNASVDEKGRLALVRATIWNGEQYDALVTLFKEMRPDIVHVHNTLPIISPAVYYAAISEGAAVVQTLHNYRLICPSGVLFRDGRPCKSCIGKAMPWPGVARRCYRGDLAASAVVASMLTYHQLRGTWREKIDRYIALTEFGKDRFVEGGIPADRVAVKPNFVSADPEPGRGNGGYALFVGRLSEEKGVRVMLDAWHKIGAGMPLRVVGDGPMREEIAAEISDMKDVHFLGPLPSNLVMDEMKSATLLVFPSIGYETFGLVAIEAFAAGTPVVASRLGAAAEIVEDGRTGFHFNPGDAGDLARVIRRMINNPDIVAAMRRVVRREYQKKYTAEGNYHQLMAIYRQAIDVQGLRESTSDRRELGSKRL